VSEAMTDWVLGIAVAAAIWLPAFASQRSAKRRGTGVAVPRWLKWISGYGGASGVDAGSFGFQFFAAAFALVNTAIVLTVPNHEGRVTFLTYAFFGLLLVTLVLVEWLRRRRMR
jgi:hypothetical protein